MIKKNAENAANVRRSVPEALSKKMRMERHLLSIGDTKTLVIHPESTLNVHSTQEEKETAGR